jgi:hypothetical protein
MTEQRLIARGTDGRIFNRPFGREHKKAGAKVNPLQRNKSKSLLIFSA